MDEAEFKCRLNLFPVLRPRNYHIDLDPSKQSTSGSPQTKDALEEPTQRGVSNAKRELQKQATDLNDGFWEKLRVATERKVGVEEAKRFCDAFQQVHKQLVHNITSSQATGI